ncbi:MAG: GTPase Obg [Parcubacteria group bacterium Gr01-1014_8]|nr:MAG: GTPase Obg [Parcubacteria group bacterium Gr01-1014_8]
MLVDDVTIKLSGGNGGPGIVGFNRTKGNTGPTGGNGGPGGDVILEGISDISALLQFRFNKDFKGEDGKQGTTRLRDGTRGEDLILKIPTGTVITNLDTGWTHELTKEGEHVMVAKGGYRGRGNFHFRASTNTTPMEAETGELGESFTFRLELKMIADVGLIGIPNAGKSSLLNELTGAHSKIGNYAFTTLEPHLGAYYGLILADVPGLIEGSSEGRGLGDRFLRHIERTRVLFHLVSAESDDVVRDYKIVRQELQAYNPALTKKEEYVFLTKVDLVDGKDAEAKLRLLKKMNKNALALSVIEDKRMRAVKDILNTFLKEKKVAPPGTTLGFSEAGVPAKKISAVDDK